MQTKLGSFIEACFSTVIGFVVTLTAGPFIYPLFGGTFSFTQNVYIALIFTVLSVLRGYVIRRWFNDRIRKAANRAAAALEK